MTGRPSLPEGFTRRPFAHRGLHGPDVPENSLPALRAAVAAGYGIEVDVQPAADGTAMVFHDSTLDRMTDRSGRIADHTPEALGEIALHGGAEIPTLARALAVIAGRVPLLVELKDQSGCFGPGPIQLEAACAPLLAGYDGPVAVISYNPHMIAALARLAPRVPRGLITRAFTPEDWPDVPLDQAHHLSRILDADRVGAALISHYHADLPSAEVARQRRAGRAVLCWTIRNPTEEATALGYADAITFEGYRPTVPSGA